MKKIIRDDGNQWSKLDRLIDSHWDNPRSGVAECESPELATKLCRLVEALLPVGMAVCVIREKELNFYHFKEVPPCLGKEKDTLTTGKTSQSESKQTMDGNAHCARRRTPRRSGRAA